MIAAISAVNTGAFYTILTEVICCLNRPAHALYFATYEISKETFGGNLPGHHPLASAAAGTIATVANDGVMTPADVVKQRLQVSCVTIG